MLHSINAESRLYVISAGHGYSCLGFDVAESRRRAVLAWLGETPAPMETGTADHYAAYLDTMARGAAHNRATGARCNANLIPALIGLEGRRVEVTDPDGERRRFIVGKSTGWLPCHLEIARRDNTGGPAAYVPAGATVRALERAR